MDGIKLAVIGAGSTYNPELIEGLIKRKDVLPLSSVSFMDINLPKVRIVAALACRMFNRAGMDVKTEVTDDLIHAIDGADFVIGQIRVGQLDARIRDEKIPLKYNLLGQETTGAGGFMNGLRTIPEILKIAEAIEKHTDDAWFINFSNPSGLMAEALNRYSSVKSIGLCNGPINMIRAVKQLMPEGAASFDYDFVGLNHFCFLTNVYADGKSYMEQIMSQEMQTASLKNIPTEDFPPELCRAIGGIPIGYLNYFLFRDAQVEKCKNAEKTRGEICQEIEAKLLKKYESKDLYEKPAELAERGGALYSEAAISLVDSIYNDRGDIHIVNVPNRGAYSFLSDNDVVECKCMVNRRGAFPLVNRTPVSQYIIGMMQALKAYERLTVEAAVTGDYTTALSALLVHPLVGDYERAKLVLDDLLDANRSFVHPGFFKTRSK